MQALRSAQARPAGEDTPGLACIDRNVAAVKVAEPPGKDIDSAPAARARPAAGDVPPHPIPLRVDGGVRNADVHEMKLTAVGAARVKKVPAFGLREGYRVLRSGARPVDRACIGIKAGRHIDGEYRAPGGCEDLDAFGNGPAGGPTDPGAQQAVDRNVASRQGVANILQVRGRQHRYDPDAGGLGKSEMMGRVGLDCAGFCEEECTDGGPQPGGVPGDNESVAAIVAVAAQDDQVASAEVFEGRLQNPDNAAPCCLHQVCTGQAAADRAPINGGDLQLTLDLQLQRTLVEALGPLHVEGIAEPVTGKTVVQLARQAWKELHPDTTVVGFGRSKLKAIRHLEAGRVDRRDAIEALAP